ncbi:hypothetical protein CSKR_204045 [Clonorchis sinensis]|uniref:Integrase catalytic domain-containing protein n=1 Tax=Clonorchis sinensis TaxID=79923 RepID=A0A8T1MWN9_CLOSI|nr:hypothetical protein CSKR_204045 [Clonorchis sinensis]
MTIRAVHIEVAHTLDTTSFLCAFSRFVARRGSPLKLYSDNGTNFRGAEADVKECLRKWDQDKLATKLLEHECDWVFSVPKASHRGGIWERLIRSIRRILRALLGDRLVDDETLQTTLTEIEKILNDRPLVKLTSDPNDYAALTPNHLLLLSANPAEASHRVDSRNLTKAWRHANHLADLFWNRWIKEYLPTLQTISKWLKQGRSLNEGDLVLLGDLDTQRAVGEGHRRKGSSLDGWCS